MNVKKVILGEYVHRTVPNLDQDQITVWLRKHFANELLWWPAQVNNERHKALWVQVAWKAPKHVQCELLEASHGCRMLCMSSS